MNRRSSFLSSLLFHALLLTSALGQNLDQTILKANVNGTDGLKWIPIGYEVVSTTPLPALSALERCGEGTQRGLKVCVPYDRCDGETNMVVAEPVNTDGAGIIDIRAGVSECESYMDACCSLPPDGEIPTPAPTSKPPVPSPEPIPPSYCGIRNHNGVGFSITGNFNGEAEYGEFPWIVAILKTSFNPSVDESLAICAGSLITPQVVLTGAHCVEKYKNNLGAIKVRAGEWDTLTEKETFPYQESGITRAIIHEDFDPKSLANDYALLLLERPYGRAPNVGTICLPPAGQTFDSKYCFTGGWGKKEFGNKESYANILKKIELPLVPHADCQDQLRKTRLGVHFVLDKSFVCAGEPGKDACTGDGGSPLVCRDPNNPQRYHQVGIVAWGIGCGDVPGAYADVSGARNWIDARITELGMDTIPYTS